MEKNTEGNTMRRGDSLSGSSFDINQSIGEDKRKTHCVKGSGKRRMIPFPLGNELNGVRRAS